MGGFLWATLGSFAFLVSPAAIAEQESSDQADRTKALQRDSWKLVRPLRDGEDPEALAAEILALDAAAATLGDEGWPVRARCAQGLRDIADVSPTALDGLERIVDDASVLFREGMSPRGSSDAWVYAMHGLGRLDEVMAWIEQRIEVEPRRSRRFAATWSSMDDAMVAAGRYDLYAQVHGDMQDEAIRMIARYTERAEKDAASVAERNRSPREQFLFSTAIWSRRSANLMLDEVATRHAALLVVGKDEDARAVASAILESQDTPEARVSLAMHAIRAGVAGPLHAQWLAEAVDQIPQEIQQAQDAAAQAMLAIPIMDDFVFDQAATEAALDQAEASDDPAIRENAKALRERLSEMRGDRGDEPPY
jgi:hypothetical protein